MKRLRCAIYTRKSTEEGLDQEFNSLDAQREACAAYIVSQAGQGWRAVNTRYDDGGFSGGSMARPGLKGLLADIEAGKVNVLVTYKVDRLTRSLTDFSRLVDLFDAHEVSFVSVTQQFNTTTSMGRLTLNVLLSFAQFEREVTAERIRDKIAASKKKGMWMGGLVPLGYDAIDKKLVINAEEAETVRTLFRLYLQLGTVAKVQEAANDLGLRTKARGPNNQRRPGYAPFTRGHLHKLLQNPVYVGEVRHKGETFRGIHRAIIDRGTWDAVQAQFTSHAVKREKVRNATSGRLLSGRLFDPKGRLMSPSHAKKKTRRYRYYVSRPPDDGVGAANDVWRVPAIEIERAVFEALAEFLGNQVRVVNELSLDGIAPGELKSLLPAASSLAKRLLWRNDADDAGADVGWVRRVEIGSTDLFIQIDRDALLQFLSGRNPTPESEPTSVEIAAPIGFRRRGVETKVLVTDGGGQQRRPDPTLIALVAQAHRWAEELRSGRANTVKELAERHGADKGDVSRTVALGFLAPDIVAAILDGRQPVELTASRLKRIGRLPPSWAVQRHFLGFV